MFRVVSRLWVWVFFHRDVNTIILAFNLQLKTVATIFVLMYTMYGDDMSKSDKLLERLLCRPKDFTFDEAATLLRHFGYSKIPGGKTGGSRIAFGNGAHDYIRIHKPHPRNELKTYQVDNLIKDLEERGLI